MREGSELSENCLPQDLVLRLLRPEDEAMFRRADRLFREQEPDTRFSFEFDGVEDFSAYVERVLGWRDGIDLPANFGANTFLVAVAGERIIGRSSVRHDLASLRAQTEGHIGMSVVPGYRHLGYGSEMFRQSLRWAGSVGLEEVLLFCDESNAVSRRMIEKCGAVEAGEVVGDELEERRIRYWCPVRMDVEAEGGSSEGGIDGAMGRQ